MAQPSNAEKQFNDLGKELYPYKLLSGDPYDQPTMPEPDRILAAIGVEFTLDEDRQLVGSAPLYKIGADPTTASAATKQVISAHREVVTRQAIEPMSDELLTFLNLAVPPTVEARMGRQDSQLIGGLVVYQSQAGLEAALFNSSRFLAELKAEAHKFVAAARNGHYPHGVGRNEVEAINRKQLQVGKPDKLHRNIFAGVLSLVVASLPDEVSLRRSLNELAEPVIPSTGLRRVAS